MQHDLVDELLAGQRVPAMSTGLADRIVAEAGRPDRARAAAPPRRRVRRWTRRGAWTAAIALNLILASAVAAAIGGAGFMPASIVAATHRMIERVRPHVPLLEHHTAPRDVPRHRAAALSRPSQPLRRIAPLAPGFAPRAAFAPRPLLRPAHPQLRLAQHRLHRPLGARVHPARLRPHLKPRALTGWRARHDAFQARGLGPGRHHRDAAFGPPRWQTPRWRDRPGGVWGRGWRRWDGPRFRGGGRRGRRW